MKLQLQMPGLTALLMLSGCAAVLDQDSALAIAPYDVTDNGLIVVEVNVNGRGPHDFALDTAASISVVFDELSDELSLEPVAGQLVTIHGAMASGRFPLLNISRVEVGREVWEQPRIAEMPGATLNKAGVDGILGVDFLRRYAVGFSTRDRVVRLYAPELVAQRSYRGWASIPLRPEYIGNSGAALYYFEIEIEGKKIPAVFDLGAGLNMVNSSAARSLGIEPSDYRSDEVLSGAIESVPLAARFSADVVRTGRIRWQNEVFSIVDLGILKILKTLQEEDRPCAILGAGLFNQRDFVIDFERSRLLVRLSMDEINTFKITNLPE